MAKLTWNKFPELVEFIDEYTRKSIELYPREMGRMIYFQQLLRDVVRRISIDITSIIDFCISSEDAIINLDASSSEVTLCALDESSSERIIYINTWFACAIHVLSSDSNVVRSILEFIEINGRITRFESYVKYAKSDSIHIVTDVNRDNIVNWLKCIETESFDLNEESTLVSFIEKCDLNVEELRKILHSYDIDMKDAIKKITDTYDETYRNLQLIKLENVILLDRDAFNKVLYTLKKLHRVKHVFNVKFNDYI